MNAPTKKSIQPKDVFEQELFELMQNTPQGVEDELMLKKDDQYIGQLSAAKVRSLFVLYETECKQLMVKKSNEEEYVPLFQHSLFQRRRPQLVSSSQLSKETVESLMVLKNGIKQGPYTIDELKELVHECQILPTDYLSIDHGETWTKIFSYEEFDRRNYIQTELPSTPEQEVLNKNSKAMSSEHFETEALTGLAYLGNLRSGKSREQAKKHYEGDVTNPSMTNPMKNDVDQFHYFWVGLFFISFAGIIMVLLTWNSSRPKLEAQQSSQPQAISQQEKVQQKLMEARSGQTPPPPKLTGQPVINNNRAPSGESLENVPTPRVQRLQNRAQAARTSLAESRGAKEAFADRAFENEADDYVYDNGDGPYEQDPVRSRVSRQTLDPESEYDDWASTLGGRAPANDESEPYADDAMDLFEDY